MVEVPASTPPDRPTNLVIHLLAEEPLKIIIQITKLASWYDVSLITSTHVLVFLPHALQYTHTYFIEPKCLQIKSYAHTINNLYHGFSANFFVTA